MAEVDWNALVAEWAPDMPDLLDKISSSAFAIFPMSTGGREPDARQLIQLGAIVWYGKPLVVLNMSGEPVPPMLAQLAEETVDAKGLTDEQTQRMLRNALALVIGRHPELGVPDV